jgi:hypothetical protein
VATTAKPAKDKELAYHTTAPIQNPKIMTEVYNKLIDEVTLGYSFSRHLKLTLKQSPQNEFQMNPYQFMLS